MHVPYAYAIGFIFTFHIQKLNAVSLRDIMYPGLHAMRYYVKHKLANNSYNYEFIIFYFLRFVCVW